MGSSRTLLVSLLALPMMGCGFVKTLSRLDFGGDDNKPFEAEMFWDRWPEIKEEDPKNPGFDADGNKIPKPETYITMYFPKITAGASGTVYGDKSRITPTVGIVAADLKAPYVRWWQVEVIGGADMVGVGLFKRWTSVFEFDTGVTYFWDPSTHKWGLAAGFTITKF